MKPAPVAGRKFEKRHDVWWECGKLSPPPAEWFSINNHKEEISYG